MGEGGEKGGAKACVFDRERSMRLLRGNLPASNPPSKRPELRLRQSSSGDEKLRV